MRLKIFIFILSIIYIIIIWDELVVAETADPYKMEWIGFCDTLMRYVNQYPTYIAAGCCDYEHKSNQFLKEEYLGEPLLTCNG